MPFVFWSRRHFPNEKKQIYFDPLGDLFCGKRGLVFSSMFVYCLLPTLQMKMNLRKIPTFHINDTILTPYIQTSADCRRTLVLALEVMRATIMTQKWESAVSSCTVAALEMRIALIQKSSAKTRVAHSISSTTSGHPLLRQLMSQKQLLRKSHRFQPKYSKKCDALQ